MYTFSLRIIDTVTYVLHFILDPMQSYYSQPFSDACY